MIIDHKYSLCYVLFIYVYFIHYLFLIYLYQDVDMARLLLHWTDVVQSICYVFMNYVYSFFFKFISGCRHGAIAVATGGILD